MLQKLSKWVCLLLGLAAAQQAAAFTFWGPLEPLQTTDLDYGNPRYYYLLVELNSGLGGVENGGPKNFGEGSRLTTPIITYGFDNTFLEYFGAQGVAAVDSAMKLLNGLPSASSANLANFITEQNQPINFTAQALDMLDLKSTVMWLMVEHMGLLGETHVFDLLTRGKNGPLACDYAYSVINRNYDPITYAPSAYVNGQLDTYEIWDGCFIGVNVGATHIIPPLTDPQWTAVATAEGLELGGYYLGLTRDDMGGLQILNKKNNYAYLIMDSNSVTSPGLTSAWEAVNATNPITGITNFAGVLGGVEKVTFVKVAFDSLYGTNFGPISYQFSIPYVTNGRLTQLNVKRTITAPDVLFTAANLVIAGLPNYLPLTRTNAFIASGYPIQPGGVVPSTVNPSELITLNNVGPVYYNIDPGFLSQQTSYETPVFNWGSFDGSTNPPIIYPNGSSLAELEQEVVSGTGVSVPIYPWAPVSTINTNTTTGGGG
ncbi:MAG TPA: hypothetical protein VGR14_19110, partial [Verrucomicrobiae bacterium]|nr:hypothetical protein [Verrucomicrobiae bacterium]